MARNFPFLVKLQNEATNRIVNLGNFVFDVRIDFLIFQQVSVVFEL